MPFSAVSFRSGQVSTRAGRSMAGRRLAIQTQILADSQQSGLRTLFCGLVTAVFGAAYRAQQHGVTGLTALCGAIRIALAARRQWRTPPSRTSSYSNVMAELFRRYLPSRSVPPQRSQGRCRRRGITAILNFILCLPFSLCNAACLQRGHQTAVVDDAVDECREGRGLIGLARWSR